MWKTLQILWHDNNIIMDNSKNFWYLFEIIIPLLYNTYISRRYDRRDTKCLSDTLENPFFTHQW